MHFVNIAPSHHITIMIIIIKLNLKNRFRKEKQIAKRFHEGHTMTPCLGRKKIKGETGLKN
jgi:hypothetical protein